MEVTWSRGLGVGNRGRAAQKEEESGFRGALQLQGSPVSPGAGEGRCCCAVPPRL